SSPRLAISTVSISRASSVLNLGDFDPFDEVNPGIRCESGSIRLRRLSSEFDIRARLLNRNTLFTPDSRLRGGTEVNRYEQRLRGVQIVLEGEECYGLIRRQDDGERNDDG